MTPFGAEELMHPSLHPRPFSDAEWLFEWKYDGFRCFVRKCAAQVELVSRQGTPLAPSFPEVVAAIAKVPGDLVWDGELATGPGKGADAFRKLQDRARLKLAKNVIVAAHQNPARLYLFDMMVAGRRDLRALSVLQRKAHLRDAFEDTAALVFSSSIIGAGDARSQREKGGAIVRPIRGVRTKNG